MDMLEDLKLWADRWKVPYTIQECGKIVCIDFASVTSLDATFSYNTETGNFVWYGGD